MNKRLQKAELQIRDFALSYPETHEDFPWGHRAIKVRKKAFLFLAKEEDELSLSLKLPFGAAAALSLKNVAPTGYGLGKNNWVTARFTANDPVDLALIRSWIDESYRAIAPKKLLVLID